MIQPEYVLQKEGLSIAYLRMMEHLSPDERAVLLLREVFDFSYLEIAHNPRKERRKLPKSLQPSKEKNLPYGR